VIGIGEVGIGNTCRATREIDPSQKLTKFMFFLDSHR
jgi:hypothetical protein